LLSASIYQINPIWRKLKSARFEVLKALDRDVWILLSTLALKSFSTSTFSVSIAIYLNKLGVYSLTLGLISRQPASWRPSVACPRGL